MTKDELLLLLGSVDSENAGIATAFVEGLEDNDVRFQRPFPGAQAAIGYWIRQERTSAGVYYPF